MKITEWLKQRIIRFLGLEKLVDNPNSERYSFIQDSEDIAKSRIIEYKIWYLGDSDELLNYYTNEQLYGTWSEPIYNRNKRNYFWSQSSVETGIKRVHSGIPNAIITTLTNAIGIPRIMRNRNQRDETLVGIMKSNNFVHLINQRQMPLTMAQGWGAFKVSINKDLSKHPIIQYYHAENVEFAYNSGILCGIIYRDFYRQNNKDYVLYETRRIKGGDSIIEYELFQLDKNNDIKPVPLSTIPSLEGLQNIVIPGFNKILGVPSIFLYDPLNEAYGRSLFAGKIDLFDDLDQILSQESQTVRVSTPVEYIPTDMLERDSQTGNVKIPSKFNRQYVQTTGITNGDGNNISQIYTTQPDLNFEQYNLEAKAVLSYILNGILSPASLGIDLSKRDNAEAQREKEKVTIMTRNNIIDRQTTIINDLLSLCLALQEYMDTGNITIQDYDLNIDFEEFANPSFESQLETLSSAWISGAISTEVYVDLLWRDTKTAEEKAKEVQWLDDHKYNQNNLGMGDFENGDNTFNEVEARTGLSLEEVDDFGNPVVK